jgi:aspartate/methionine/tyrosine aminotransferase
VASRHAMLCATMLYGMPTADVRCCSLHQSGEESFELYEKERDGVLGSLKRRAKIMVDALNKLEGISCQPTEGVPPAVTYFCCVPCSSVSLLQTATKNQICILELCQVCPKSESDKCICMLLCRRAVRVPAAAATQKGGGGSRG